MVEVVVVGVSLTGQSGDLLLEPVLGEGEAKVGRVGDKTRVDNRAAELEPDALLEAAITVFLRSVPPKAGTVARFHPSVRVIGLELQVGLEMIKTEVIAPPGRRLVISRRGGIGRGPSDHQRRSGADPHAEA